MRPQLTLQYVHTFSELGLFPIKLSHMMDLIWCNTPKQPSAFKEKSCHK